MGSDFIPSREGERGGRERERGERGRKKKGAWTLWSHMK